MRTLENFTGETLSRGEVISTKRWCRSTNIFVMNTKGEILCHQRSLNKERHPGWWMTHFGGHVSGEETFDDNAIKELQEEIGLSVAAEELLPWRTSRKTDARLWVRDYITIFDGDISELVLQESEIQRVKWFTAEEIYAQLDREDPMKQKDGKQVHTTSNMTIIVCVQYSPQQCTWESSVMHFII